VGKPGVVITEIEPVGRQIACFMWDLEFGSSQSSREPATCLSRATRYLPARVQLPVCVCPHVTLSNTSLGPQNVFTCFVKILTVNSDYLLKQPLTG
jgi:hypothetical protein